MPNASCAINGPCHRPTSHDPAARTAPQMGYAPEQLGAAPDEVPANVVKARRTPRDAWAAFLTAKKVNSLILGWRLLHMIDYHTFDRPLVRLEIQSQRLDRRN